MLREVIAEEPNNFCNRTIAEQNNIIESSVACSANIAKTHIRRKCRYRCREDLCVLDAKANVWKRNLFRQTDAPTCASNADCVDGTTCSDHPDGGICMDIPARCAFFSHEYAQKAFTLDGASDGLYDCETWAPTLSPTLSPTLAPSSSPSQSPSASPTKSPTFAPTSVPTVEPTRYPTFDPCSGCKRLATGEIDRMRKSTGCNMRLCMQCTV